MRLTPLDIQQKQFARTLRGYDPREVRQFLEFCSDEFEELVRETIELREEVRGRDRQLAEVREREHALQEALVSARRLADEMREQARKDAEVIVAEAELQAERIVQDAHARRTTLIGELTDLKQQKIAFETRIRAEAESHLKLLEALQDTERQRVLDDKVTLLQKKSEPA
jgi:cell division initiation protein